MAEEKGQDVAPGDHNVYENKLIVSCFGGSFIEHGISEEVKPTQPQRDLAKEPCLFHGAIHEGEPPGASMAKIMKFSMDAWNISDIRLNEGKLGESKTANLRVHLPAKAGPLGTAWPVAVMGASRYLDSDRLCPCLSFLIRSEGQIP